MVSVGSLGRGWSREFGEGVRVGSLGRGWGLGRVFLCVQFLCYAHAEKLLLRFTVFY